MPKLRFDQYLSVFVIVIFFIFEGTVFFSPLGVIANQPTEILLIKPAAVPIKKEILNHHGKFNYLLESPSSNLMVSDFASSSAISENQSTNQKKDEVNYSLVSALSFIVIDQGSATILAEKNAHEKFYPASTTKMLTALTASQLYDLKQLQTVTAPSQVNGNNMGLVLHEQLTMENLLRGVLIHSANDAAYVLANQYPAGYQVFIQEMNQLAKKLHLKDSHFTNPAGLDDVDHYSSAFDLALIARELIKDPFMKELVGTKELVITDVTGQVKHHLVNTNALLGTEPGVKGIKTGTTDLAGQVLVTLWERQGQEILIVVMGSEDRYTDTKVLINWVFDNYQWQDID